MLPCCGALRCLELEFVWRETAKEPYQPRAESTWEPAWVGRVWYSLPPDKALPWTCHPLESGTIPSEVTPGAARAGQGTACSPGALGLSGVRGVSGAGCTLKQRRQLGGRGIGCFAIALDQLNLKILSKEIQMYTSDWGTCTHIHTHTHMCTHSCAHTRTHMYTYIYIQTCTYAVPGAPQDATDGVAGYYGGRRGLGENNQEELLLKMQT